MLITMNAGLIGTPLISMNTMSAAHRTMMQVTITPSLLVLLSLLSFQVACVQSMNAICKVAVEGSNTLKTGLKAHPDMTLDEAEAVNKTPNSVVRTGNPCMIDPHIMVQVIRSNILHVVEVLSRGRLPNLAYAHIAGTLRGLMLITILEIAHTKNRSSDSCLI